MTPRKNYRKECAYCGAEFESNRSTAKYCCDQHGSLYRKDGRINNCVKRCVVMLESNNVCDYKDDLQAEKAHMTELQAEITQKTRARFVKHNTALTDAYNAGIIQPAHMWKRMIHETHLRERFGYNGDLPTRDQLIFAGEYVLETNQHFNSLVLITPTYYYPMDTATLQSIRFMQSKLF